MQATGMMRNANRQSSDEMAPPTKDRMTVASAIVAPKTPMAAAIRDGGVTALM